MRSDHEVCFSQALVDDDVLHTVEHIVHIVGVGGVSDVGEDLLILRTPAVLKLHLDVVCVKEANEG